MLWENRRKSMRLRWFRLKNAKVRGKNGATWLKNGVFFKKIRLGAAGGGELGVLT